MTRFTTVGILAVLATMAAAYAADARIIVYVLDAELCVLALLLLPYLNAWLPAICIGLGIVPGTTLVVVDMQVGFLALLADPEPVVQAVLKEIARARRHGHRIVVLEYRFKKRDSGKTDPRILQALEGYPYWAPMDKHQSGGGNDVRSAYSLLRFGTERFQLVGLNLDACVYLTAIDLSVIYEYAQVEVLTHACDTSNTVGWAQYLRDEARRIRLLDNALKLVRVNDLAPAALPPAD